MYNVSPFVYDQEGFIHQLSNAKKASKYARGTIVIRTTTGFVILRKKINSVTLVDKEAYLVKDNDTVKRSIISYGKNSTALILGHAFEIQSLTSFVYNYHLETQARGLKPIAHSQFIEALITYYQKRFLSGFPVGGKILLLDKNEDCITTIDSDGTCEKAKICVQGNITTEEATDVLSKIGLFEKIRKLDDLTIKPLAYEIDIDIEELKEKIALEAQQFEYFYNADDKQN